MGQTVVECPECAEPMDLDESQLGQTVKCPKCKSRFEATVSEGAYEIVPDPTPRPRPSRPASSSPSKKPRPDSSQETEEQRQLRERMEKWADDVG